MFLGRTGQQKLSGLKDLNDKGCVAFKSFIGPVSPDYDSLSYGQAYEAMEIKSEDLLYVNQISAFVGMKGKGLPVLTMVRGNIIAENGKIVAKEGIGSYISRI